MKKLETSGGLKVRLSEKEYKSLIKESGRDSNFQESFEVLEIGAIKMLVTWPDGWTTISEERRKMGLVTSSEKLGSYVGISKGEDGYHLGVAFQGDSPIKKEMEKLLEQS